MGKQSGVIKIEGNVDGLNYIKTRRGYFVRKKPSISKHRIKTEPNFQKTRENNVEFTDNMKSNALLKRALTSVITDVRDGMAHNRLSSVLSKVKDEDRFHEHGSRVVAAGIVEDAGKTQLKGFEFNDKAKLDSIFYKSYSLDTEQGILKIPGFNPYSDVRWHWHGDKVGFILVWTKVDFVSGEFNTMCSEEVMLAIPDGIKDVILDIPNPPSGKGTNIFALRVVFYEVLNSRYYLINHERFTCAKILEVK